VFAEPSRRSLWQAAIKTVVLVSQRATNRLIRQLDLAGSSEPIGDAALQQYIDHFKGPLAPNTIAAIRATTRLADGTIPQVAAALAQEELAAQVNAAVA
jgi:hypothetical protein